MNKFEDKLRNLKTDIPRASEAFDDKVVNTMLMTKPKPRLLSFPKLALLAGGAVPVLALTLVLVFTLIPGLKMRPHSSEGINQNTSMGQMAPGEETATSKFSAAKSAVTAGVDIDLGQDVYTHFDLTYATSTNELQNEISKYHDDYQTIINPLITSILANEAYFTDNNVALVPFMFSSSETNITLNAVNEHAENNTTVFEISLYSPLENDMDLNVMFYVVTLPKVTYNITLNNNLEIKISNTRDSEAGSMYYDK